LTPSAQLFFERYFNRWIRLNDDICSSCQQPKFVWLELVETGLNILITCNCPSSSYNPYGTCWAQVDNMTVEDMLYILGEAIQND
jgi:threonine/homoserine efflux transporter RhtA